MRNLSFALPGTWARFDLQTIDTARLPQEVASRAERTLATMAAAGFAEVLVRTGTITPTTIVLGWVAIETAPPASAEALRPLVRSLRGETDLVEAGHAPGYVALQESPTVDGAASDVYWIARSDDDVLLMVEVTTYGPGGDDELRLYAAAVSHLVWTDDSGRSDG